MIHHLSIPARDTRRVAEVLTSCSAAGSGSVPTQRRTSPYVATHATVSVDRTAEEIEAVAGSVDWRAVQLSRGPHDIVERWIENAVMLELMTPEMTADYLASTAQ